MSAIKASAWSNPFPSRYESACDLCGASVRINERIAILATLTMQDDDGERKRTILGHARCLHLDTPGWRRTLFGKAAETASETLLVELEQALCDKAELEAIVAELQQTVTRNAHTLALYKKHVANLRAELNRASEETVQKEAK